MDPKILAWCALGATLIGVIVSALRPDNKALPFEVPTRVRVVLALVLGAVQTGLQNVIDGTPWGQAAAVALVSVVAALLGSAAPRAATGLLLLFVLASTSACDAFTPKRIHGAAELVKCALENRMMQPADIAVKCGFEHVQDVVDVIAGEDQRMGTARSLGVSEGRQLGAEACPKR